MNIDFVVMAHTTRTKYIPSIVEHFDESKITIDDGTLGVWGNAKQAWNMVDPKTDYGIVIQDDAILCDDFKYRAETFISQHNGHFISFYFGHSVKTFKYLRPQYFDAPLHHAVALAIPTPLIPDMIAYADTRHEIDGDDMKMKRWLISKNMVCRYSNPSLVQHRNIPSIIDPTKPPRQSAIFKK